MIYQLLAITLNQDHIDILMWKRRDGTLGDFSVRQTYYDRQNTNEVVTWSKLAWFSQNISKHAFILWLAIQGKHTAEDKVLITKLSRMQNGNTIGSIIRRLCLAACVYLIWQERNNRVFRDVRRETLIVGLYIVKGKWPGWALHDERNLGPFNAMPQEVWMVMDKGECFLPSDACFSLFPEIVRQSFYFWSLEFWYSGNVARVGHCGCSISELQFGLDPVRDLSCVVFLVLSEE
ncbi:hypothetical protein Tco_0642814 [Tanacetum coccineum]